jgi:hypothetical protein
MKSRGTGRIGILPHDRGETRPKSRLLDRLDKRNDRGSSLVELLIVVTITPMIAGGLAVGLLTAFSLQSGVSSRLSHTGDAQVVSAIYQKDIQGTAYVTTQSSSSPQCVSATPIPGAQQLLGLESDPLPSGDFLTHISYVSVPTTSGATTTNSLVRLNCTGGSLTTANQTVLAYDMDTTQSQLTVSCVASVSASVCNGSSQQWVSAQNIKVVTFVVTDPKKNFTYTLVASPVASTTSVNTGAPFTAGTTARCVFASPGTGAYAATMCFVDFAPLTGPALAAAQGGGCLEMSVSLPNNYTMYFCLSLTGGQVLPWYLPTWTNAFLGNSINGVPFYTGISGDPALYQRVEGSAPSVVTFHNISVVSPSGALATGWEAVSADAESSDVGESITWTSNVKLTVIPNGEPGQTQPVGNACQSGTLLTGSGTTTVTCSGGSVSVGTKTGTAMVWAPAPTTLTATMVGVGLQAITFGMLLP